MAVPDTLLTARNLYVARGGLPVLRDVSMSLSAGHCLAILGGNGSGKTTLIRAVLGLTAHQEGSVELFGSPLAKFTEWHRIGYVPQHTQLQTGNVTVKELVSTGRLAHRPPFTPFRRQDRAAVAQALARVGLTDRAHWPVNALSGGQRQRAVIGRALATEPELLIMDEPMAGVDLHSQAGLAELLGELRDAGLGLAVVLHETGAMTEILDSSITLCDGRVVTGETPTPAGCEPLPERTAASGLDGVFA